MTANQQQQPGVLYWSVCVGDQQPCVPLAMFSLQSAALDWRAYAHGSESTLIIVPMGARELAALAAELHERKA